MVAKYLRGMVGIVCAGFLLCLFAASIFSDITARATGANWFSLATSSERIPDGKIDNAKFTHCSTKLVTLGDGGSAFACAQSAKSFKIAQTQNGCVVSGSNCLNQYATVVSFDNDQKMYRIANFPWNSENNCLMVSSGTDDLVVGCSGELHIIPDFPRHLKIANVTTTSRVFNLDSTSVRGLQNQSGVIGIESAAMSNNGEWVVAMTSNPKNQALLRIHLTDGTVKMIDNYLYRGLTGYDLAVSNDGGYIFVSESGWPMLYDASGECGVTSENYQSVSSMEGRSYSRCARGQLMSAVFKSFPGVSPLQLTSFRHPQFTDDGYELEGQAYINTAASGGNLPGAAWIRITAEGRPTYGLEYLALGDSYSSGEGDTDGLFGPSHYRAGTNEGGPPVEKCHISTRSYPYILANLRFIPADKWQTIACSGAMIQDDYYGSNDGYIGQGSRLNVLSLPMQAQYKATAITNFIPGRNKQIEFVKKYQPRIVTMTGSGNDVGFASVITECISKKVLDLMDLEDTCDKYAKGSHGRYTLANDIKQQYDHIRSLIRTLKQASPDTVVYYVGYPQFIASSDASCGGFVRLSKDERAVFRDAVTYLNSIIKAAAQSEGAVYVDIEDSLGDHKLCDKQDAYVNGFNADCGDSVFVRFFAGKDDCQEAFHPKPEGYELMAKAIDYQMSHADTQTCGGNVCKVEIPLSDVSMPEVFRKAFVEEFNVNYIPVHGGNVMAAQKGNNDGKVTVEVPYLEPNSQAYVYMTSTPTEIGNFQVNSDGTLKLSFTVPDSLPAGYHTLHVETHTFSGEPIELWWTVRIFGAEGDVDEDGIPDGKDACNFMPMLSVDSDHDGIDDGCDSNIVTTTSSISNNVGLDTSKTSSSLDGQASDKDLVSQQRPKQSSSNNQAGSVILIASVVITILAVMLIMVMLKSRYRHASKK